MNRRLLLGGAAASVAALAAPRALLAADYDLVIRGGRAMDPSRAFDALTDVAIRGGLIAALGPNMPLSAATQSIDARGKIVVPGLIDVHLHARDAELPPSEILGTSTTTRDRGPARSGS
jgi:dihydroorotase